MTVPRIVLDTNVLVSALLFPARRLTWLREAWQSEAVVPLASGDTTRELIRVLSYPKFHLTADERDDLLDDYLPWCETVAVSERLDTPVCRDPSDRPFLELALEGRADALITGDDDLLVLAPAFPVPILSPNAARDLVGVRSAGKARIGGPNRRDLYPSQEPFLPPGSARRLLNEERGDR